MSGWLRFSPLLVAAILLATVNGPTLALEGEKKVGTEKKKAPGKGSDPSGASAKLAREFWKSLSPGEREEFCELYRSLKRLRPVQQKRILERLKKLPPERRAPAIRRARDSVYWSLLRKAVEDQERRVVEKRLPAALTRRLEGVSAAERRKAIQSFYARHQKSIRASREKRLAKLPEETRKRVAGMTPVEQAEFLRNYTGDQLFKGVFREPGTRKKMLASKPRDLLFLLEKKPRERPAFFPEAAWPRWEKLKPYERLRVIRAMGGKRLERKRPARDQAAGASTPKKPARKAAPTTPAPTTSRG